MKRLLILAIALAPLSSFASSHCDEYYKTVDNYIEIASKKPELKSQVDLISQQYEQTKKQLAAMPEDTREASCKQGLDAMKIVEEQIKKMQK